MTLRIRNRSNCTCFFVTVYDYLWLSLSLLLSVSFDFPLCFGSSSICQPCVCQSGNEKHATEFISLFQVCMHSFVCYMLLNCFCYSNLPHSNRATLFILFFLSVFFIFIVFFSQFFFSCFHLMYDCVGCHFRTSMISFHAKVWGGQEIEVKIAIVHLEKVKTCDQYIITNHYGVCCRRNPFCFQIWSIRSIQN